MNDQDKRAVEGLARSGISFEGLRDSFPRYPEDEIRKIYEKVQTILTGTKEKAPEIKTNCS